MRLLLVALIGCACNSASEPPPAPPAPMNLAALIPKVASAKVLSAKSPNDAYAMETWCIDEANAGAQVSAALTRDGWRDVRTTGPQLAIAAMKDDIRFSARSSSNQERCAGTYLTATVMRLGATKP